ncbi:MAG TPA: CocE/NonD family hydrolase [Thermohalobaculum sp.]|nr:CocE/NonD family hydrolase [Thermohalobaculum sp.]
MSTATTLPDGVREIAHVDVPMPDGCRLGARLWLPEGAKDPPVPAIREYIPYRKNDLCSPEDRAAGTWLARHGYAYVRLDVRGAGDSEGLLPDEYLPQELQDGCDAIAWIAAQPWCDGGVGMIGISWGGFNGLQIAALRPPALKAVITVCSTDDRYADDIHTMGGCLLLDQLSWASQMFARNSLPPDPENRADWRALWLERLEGSGLWLKNWLEHQHRDAFWQHGSVSEDYSAIEVPVYAVGGWADGYCRAVFRLCEHLPGPRKGLIGPWAHKYPHLGVPGPAIGFMAETQRWWDHWLKGQDTGIMDEPMLRLFMQDHAAPQGYYEARAGRWVAEPSWPSPNVGRRALHLGACGTLSFDAPGEDAALVLRSPVFSGAVAGKWCSYATPGDQPGDQRIDDGGALLFDTAPLTEAVEIAGDPVLEVTLASDRPVAQIAARLVDVAPDGAATRVSYGVLNLTHRDSHEHPEPLPPGRPCRVRVPLKTVAQTFRPGHRIRLALSSTYFPMIWPAPRPATLTLRTAASALHLPVRTPSPDDDALRPFDPPEALTPAPRETLEDPGSGWRHVHDLGTGERALEVVDGSGVYLLTDPGITVTKKVRERYSATGDDLATVTGETAWEMGLARGDWRIRTVTETRLTATPDDFRVEARLRAWDGGALAFEREWDERIERDLV